MKSKFNFKLGALCVIISAMLVMPALGQTKEKAGARHQETKRPNNQRAEACS